MFGVAAMPKGPFYAEGLRFSCTRCSACCRYGPGVVFLSEKDAGLLAIKLEMGYTDFVETYCRWIPVDMAGTVSGEGRERLSLKERSNYDCIFWNNGCSVYEARPLQCRTFPFWKSVLASPDIWEGLDCPGAGKGTLHGMQYIESCLARREAEAVIERKVRSRFGGK
jgi:Fe-S-cluster containining protein